MSKQEIGYFFALKKKLEETFQNRHANCTDSIQDWKGQDIRAFQSDLQETVGGYISEKWFYTHIKADDNEKLPRIDILNMLSTYIGFDNWEQFIESTFPTAQINEKNAKGIENEVKQRPAKKLWRVKIKWILGLAAVGLTATILIPLLLTAAVFSSKAPKTYNCRFCFVDADTKNPINTKVSMGVLADSETPLHLQSDKNACVELKHNKDKISFVVSAAYYKVDTIERSLESTDYKEVIPLKKDDYALMLHYFSTHKVSDWKKRKAQLEEIIAEDAQIVQIMESDDYGETGIEIYTKSEFINKLTMPLHSLENIEILKTDYREGLIVQIRFKQNEE